MTETIKIEGVEELNRVLSRLPHQIQGRLIYAAMRRAAQPMKQEAVNLAPKRKGTIKRAITIVKERNTEEPFMLIGVTKGKRVKNDAWYAHFQEKGTTGFGKAKKTDTWDRGYARTAIMTGRNVFQIKSGRKAGKFRITLGHKLRGNGLPAVRFMATAFNDKVDVYFNSMKKELSKVVSNYLKKNAPNYNVG